MKTKLLNILIEARQNKEHNLMVYSANYALTRAKEGYEKEFKQAKQEYSEVLQVIEHYITE